MVPSLRRRIPDGSQPLEETSEKIEEVRLAPISKITDHRKVKGGKRRNGFIFFLGGLAGIVAAGLFAKTNDLIDLPEFGELSMDSLLDVLPASFVRDARDLVVYYLRFLAGFNY
jgi:phospholipid:diacylglycerol acyltransferase